MPANVDTTNNIAVSALTQNLIAQCEQTVGEQQQTRRSAESCEATLNSQWGGQASGAYRNALASWSANLDQVRVAQMELQGAIAEYAKNNATTENDNLQAVTRVSNMVTTTPSWT